MTDFAGHIDASGFYGAHPPPGGYSRVVPVHGRAWEGTLPEAGTLTDTQPVTAERATNFAGFTELQYGFLDFYNRFHFDPGRLDLGNVISSVRPILVWNGYLTPQVLTSITPFNDEGLTLTQPRPAPMTFAPFEELTYELVVSAEGPPTIAATYTWDFGTAEDFVFYVTGRRVLAWVWEPDGNQPVSERWEWLTDVITSKNGHEQRRALRQSPRRALRFRFEESGDSRGTLETSLYISGAKLWALPIFTDGVPTLAAVPNGTEVIPCDTTGRDFREDGLALLIADGVLPELVTILAVNPGDIELTAPVVGDFPNRTRLYPVRSARLQMTQGYARRTAERIEGEAVFLCEDAPVLEALDEDEYRGIPVCTQEFNWREPPMMAQERKVEIWDPMISAPAWTDESGMPNYIQTVSWTCLDRTEIDIMRRFLHTRRGRYKRVWMPTWARDMEVVDTISPTLPFMEVRKRGLSTNLGAGAVNRQDFRMELKDGTVFYRRVVALEEVTTDTERVEFDTALGQEVEAADIKLISWMALMRLDGDGIEIAYKTQTVAEAVLSLRSYNNDA